MNQLKTICFAITLVSGILLFSVQAHAVSYALTGFTYDTGAGMVYGTSQTYLDYDLDTYYNAGVDGYLIKYNDPTLSSYTILGSGSQNHQYDAVVLTSSSVQRGETYAVFSDHFLQTTLYYYGYPYDPYGISYNYFGEGGGSPYYGFQYWQAVIMQDVWFYLGRTGVIVSLPDITQLAPDAGLPGTTPAVQILGKYIGEHTQIPPIVSVSGYGVTAQFGNFLPNGVEVYLQIAEDADIGDHTVSLTSDGVLSNSVNFRVGDRSPQITGITPPQGNTGDQVNVTITGTNFGVNPQVQIDGSGVSPTITSASSTEIQAIFSIADLTYPGNRNITIKSNGRTGGGFTPGAGNSDTSNAVNFTVFSPTITIPDIPVVEKNGERSVDVTISGLASPGDKIKFTLKPLPGATGAAKFDNNSTEIVKENNGTHNLKIIGVSESNEINKMTIEATPLNSSIVLQHKEFTVAVISSLEFERINSDDILLDNNPGTDGTHTAEEGLRIFPDKKDPADATDRSILRLKATVLPNDPSLTVYFASFDLDDPSTNTVIDTNGGNGNDNNGAVNGSGSGELLNPVAGGCTGASTSSVISKIQCPVSSGGASTNYKVSMQPGDNFAIAASLVENYRNQIVVNTSAGENLINSGNQIIPISGEANPNSIQGIRSRMLTVWRKLHIEVDSMGKAKENYAAGNVVNAASIPAGGTASLNLSTTGLEVNRFEKGRIEIGASAGALTVTGNTDNTVNVVNNTANDIIIANNSSFNIINNGGTRTVAGIIPAGTTIAPTAPATLAVNSTSLGGNTFQNGTLTVISALNSLSVTANTTSTVSVTNAGTSVVSIAANSIFRLYDDDDFNNLDGANPDGDDGEDIPMLGRTYLEDSDNPTLNHFVPAYIVPKYDIGDNNDSTEFRLNVATDDVPGIRALYDFDQIATEADPTFWTLYLLSGYQYVAIEDEDAETESATVGVADVISDSAGIGRGWGANVYLETNGTKECSLDHSAIFCDIHATKIHEIGHQFGAEHGDMGVMDDMSTDFSPESLITIRRRTYP